MFEQLSRIDAALRQLVDVDGTITLNLPQFQLQPVAFALKPSLCLGELRIVAQHLGQYLQALFAVMLANFSWCFEAEFELRHDPTLCRHIVDRFGLNLLA